MSHSGKQPHAHACLKLYLVPYRTRYLHCAYRVEYRTRHGTRYRIRHLTYVFNQDGLVPNPRDGIGAGQ